MQVEGPHSDIPSDEVTDGGASGSPLDRFLPHSLRTGRRGIPQSDEENAVTDEAVDVAPRLGEVGAHVELVLAAAEEAAKQIRQEAQEAARQIRVEAGRDAALIHNEAEEALRAAEHKREEVAQYVVDTRAEADSQAEQALREAKAEAARMRADAAREAGRLVAEAERRGQELEDAARRRTQQLAEEADGIEGRLDDWLATLRTLTDQLERRLAIDTPAEADAEPLDEALARPATQRDESKEESRSASSRKARGKSQSRSR
jgi:hypothetical protein